MDVVVLCNNSGKGRGLKRKNMKRKGCSACIGIRVICASAAGLGSIVGIEGRGGSS